MTRGKLGEKLYHDKWVAMGTFVEVISPDKNAAKIVFDEISRIEGLLSKYKPESEVSRLNKLGTLKVSPETFYIIKKAKDFYALSNGAFDITVAPLINLWGFTSKQYYLPSDREIKNTLRLIGSDKIVLHENNSVIQFKIRGMQIDLGAIAKGFAIDCAVAKLKDAGIKSCLINAGGQIYCLGNRFFKPWKVAIKDPRKENRLAGYLELKDKAVSTSGDYEQFFFKGNKRYSHILNPKTGYPADTDIIAVTIISNDGLTADAVSTMIFVLGKQKWEEIASKINPIEVRILESEKE
jgi:thiamine biosynthesis lipoprotein